MVTKMTQADVVANLEAVLVRVRAGEEIVVQSESQPDVTIRAAYPRRTLSQSLAIAEARTKERGFEAVMDADFAADVEERIRNRKPRDTSAWDEPQP